MLSWSFNPSFVIGNWAGGQGHHQERNVGEVKLDISTKLVTSPIEDLGQLEQLLKQKLETFTRNN